MRLQTMPTPAILFAAIITVVACSHDGPTAPQGDPMLICHVSGTSGTIIAARAPELATHVAHGDYATWLTVTALTIPAGDSTYYRRIGDALAAARAGRIKRGELQSAACRITINVAAGTYRGDAKGNPDPTVDRFPILVDMPDISLQGALQMGHTDAGRALGTGAPGVETTLAPVSPLQIEGGASSQTGASTPMIIANAHPGGSAGNGLTVSGMVFQSGHVGVDTLAGGQGVSSMRVRDLVISGNRFEGGFTESIDLRASSARVVLNYFGAGGGSCDVCLAGPGAYVVADNRLMAGGIPGVFVIAALQLPVWSTVEPYTLPATSEVTATVTNNEIRDHLRKPVGAAIRVGAIGIGAPNVVGSTRVTAKFNYLVNNTFAMIVEAAFPVANTTLRGDVSVTLGENVIQQSCQADLLVSFSRHTTALGLSNIAYERASTYDLALGGDLQWADAWFSHPAGLANTLIVNGQSVANGARASYNAAKTCAPLP
jgi:hypothetical protein